MLTEEAVVTEKKLQLVIRHIKTVQENCEILGNKLIEEGEADFGRQLIANGLIHDHSKFTGIEWLYLHEDTKQESPDLFKLALEQHNTTNRHHPEYLEWDGIEQMPRIYVAEMCCDWKARSSEFGSDLREWIKEKACKKYGITHASKVYKQIKDFVDLLLERKFS